MSDIRYAVDISIDICDLSTEDEADEIRDRIEEAIAAWKPTIAATTREYPTET
nr:rop guanine nucleotide exchange factor [Streptomyces sp. NBC_00830]